jgi:hypothetical protein
MAPAVSRHRIPDITPNTYKNQISNVRRDRSIKQSNVTIQKTRQALRNIDTNSHRNFGGPQTQGYSTNSNGKLILQRVDERDDDEIYIDLDGEGYKSNSNDSENDEMSDNIEDDLQNELNAFSPFAHHANIFYTEFT